MSGSAVRLTLVPGKDAEVVGADSLAMWPVYALEMAAFARALVALHTVSVTAGKSPPLPPS